MVHTTRKSIFSFSILVLFLSACSASAPTSPTPAEVRPILPETPTPAAPECSGINIVPTPSGEVSSLFPPVSEGDMVRGPVDAAVTIIEYGDFQ